MIVRTLNEVAQALNVSYHTVRSWRLQGAPGTPGNYDVVAIRDWRKSREELRQPATREEIIRQLADYIATGEPVPKDIAVSIERRFGSHHTIEIFSEARRMVAAKDAPPDSPGPPPSYSGGGS